MALNFLEDLVVEKDLHSIGVIEDTNGPKESKEDGKKKQAYSSKAK